MTRSAHCYPDSPSRKAAQCYPNSPSRKAAKCYPDSPSGKAVQCYTDSPSRKAAQCYPDSPSGKAAQCYPDFPSGKAHDTREHHTQTIAYPIRICCPDHWLKWANLATAHVPPPSCPDIFYSLHSGFAYGRELQSFDSSCLWALHCLAMDSKGLSSI